MENLSNIIYKAGLVFTSLLITPATEIGTSEKNHIKNDIESFFLEKDMVEILNYHNSIEYSYFLKSEYSNKIARRMLTPIYENYDGFLEETLTEKKEVVEEVPLSNIEKLVLLTGEKFRIVIDPSHGFANKKYDKDNRKHKEEMDWGDARYMAKDSTYQEADMALHDGKTLGEMLDPNSFEIYYTRENNEEITPLEFRSMFARRVKADLFISIHVNNFEPSRKQRKWLEENEKEISGFEIFYRKDTSKAFAEIVYKNFVKLFPINHDQIEERKRLRKEKFIVLNLDIPAILVEPGFLSHPQDAKYLFQVDTPDSLKIPYTPIALANSIEEYFENISGEILAEMDSIQNLELIAKESEIDTLIAKN